MSSSNCLPQTWKNKSRLSILLCSHYLYDYIILCVYHLFFIQIAERSDTNASVQKVMLKK